MHTPNPSTTHRGDTIARWVVRISGLTLLLISPLFVGCKASSKLTGKQEKQDLLEAELRTREREILEARSELQYLRQNLELQQRVPSTCPPVVPTTLGTGQTLKSITLGNGTGGFDQDGIPGDESLQVVIVPKDADGTASKALGHATVTAYEITPEGIKRPIGRWEVSNDQLRKSWKQGLITSGYHVPLQWDRPPTTDRLRVSVTFVSADGRPFETDRDVSVIPMFKQNPTIVPPTIIGPDSILPPPGAVLIPGIVK